MCMCVSVRACVQERPATPMDSFELLAFCFQISSQWWVWSGCAPWASAMLLKGHQLLCCCMNISFLAPHRHGVA